MAEIALPVVVTAIANTEFESFVAGTLFSQGWNVIFRALDISSLVSFINADPAQSRNVVLLYSPDLPGISPDSLSPLLGKVRQVIGFASGDSADQDYEALFGIAHDEAQLLNLVRGFVRAPLLRTAPEVRKKRRKTKVIAIGSSSGSPGCTSFAINLAMEMSVLGSDTMLVDADIRHPSIAPLLSLHKLDAEQSSRNIAPHLNVSEFHRERVPELQVYLEELFDKSDFAIIDLGSIQGISDSLTDRRWTSAMINWSCEQADDLWIVGKSDVLSIHRLESLAYDFTKLTIHATLNIALNMSARGRRGKAREDLFFAAAAPLNPEKSLTLPRDIRSINRAEEERATLIETDDRSPLRKSIAKLASELCS